MLSPIPARDRVAMLGAGTTNGAGIPVSDPYVEAVATLLHAAELPATDEKLEHALTF